MAEVKHKFYKYRTSWSSGPSQWHFIRLDVGQTPKSSFDEMANEHSWSEHFRGIEYHRVKLPPKEWLQNEIDSLKSSAKWRKRLAIDYQTILTCQKKKKNNR